MKTISIPTNISVELAEETGWHIGDGSMNYYDNKGYNTGLYQLRGHIEDDKEHYETIIKPIFKLLYDLDISLREMPLTRVFGFQIWNSRLVDFKKDLGLPLGKKSDVLIPEIFLTSDEFKIAVVRGIFDTDGCVYLQPKYGKLYPRIEIMTISQTLSKQLFNILKELGLRTTVYDWLPKLGNRKKAYKITVRGKEMFDKFMQIIQPNNPKHIRKYNLFKESFK